jgi:putative ABC transport system permease protein
MLKYHILLFVRNLRRQKLFSFINLLGLTVSIVSTLLIYLYVSHEFSYDRFHHHADRIYRVNQTYIWGENNDPQFASTGPGVAVALKEELPEAELVTSIHTPGNFLVAYTNPAKEVVAFREEGILAADSNFFKMFNFPAIKGSTETALLQANTMVMTASTAKKYFGNGEPIGKLVRVGEGEQQQTYEVTAVVSDTPENSYIEFDILLSMTSFPTVEKRHWSWVWTQLETFIRLEKDTDLKNTLAKLEKIPRKYAEETLQRVMNVSYDEYIKSGKKWELFLQPLTAIHLPSKAVYNRLNDSGDLKIIYSLMGAGAFIVLLSCINFMNLSTAQFTRRIKESGIRKVLGIDRSALRFGFFIEAFIFCMIAFVFALAITQLTLPAFNVITGKELSINLFLDSSLLLTLGILVVGMTLLSGSYPALFLSGVHPVEAMKGKFKVGGKTFRNGLVVFQFSVSIVLMVCTAIVFQQLRYVADKDLGFNKENLLVIKHAELVKNGETLANASLAVPGVVNATWSSSVPPTIFGGDQFTAEGFTDKTFPLNFTTADEGFIPTMDISLKAGRNFSKDIPADTGRVILNEMALKRIGWMADETAIGKKIQIPGTEIYFEVVGVVDDFNYWRLQVPIEPMAIFHIANSQLFGAGDTRFVTLRIAPQNTEAWQTTLASVESLWKLQAGDTPFQYEFIDQSFADTFKSHEQFGKALTIIASLAILIACLGLLGMIVYSLEQRTKEIGIRKVSGATAWNILLLISKGYTKLIVLAFLLGAPLSYWLMQQWLQDFAFRITPSPIVFLSVGVGTLGIAVLITGYHSIKAALRNPVEVLKDE